VPIANAKRQYRLAGLQFFITEKASARGLRLTRGSSRQSKSVGSGPPWGVGAENYKTEEACINANAGTNDTFRCVTRNWLDKSQRKPCVPL